MTIQNFITALLLSTSLIYFCATDCIMNKPQTVFSSSVENAIPADLTATENSQNDNDNNNQQRKGNSHTSMNYSTDGIVLTFTDIKEKVKKHYTGMLPQKKAIYQRA